MTIKDGKLDKKNLVYAAGVLTEAFKDDPLYKTIFKNEKELRVYLKLLLIYYNRNGEIHVARAGDKIVAASVWNPKGAPFMTIRNMLKSGMFFDLLEFFIIMHVKSMKKLKNEVLITEQHHYKRAHNYLFLIGSVMKGAGRSLMEYAIGKYRDCPIYLENSNIKGNRLFYEQLGFHSLKTIEVMGVPVDLLTNSKGDRSIEEIDRQCVH